MIEMMKITPSALALLLAGLLIGISLWRAHSRADIEFNLLDLLMENGRVSKIAVAFMLVLGVTTWVTIHLTLSGRLTEGYLGLYLGAWVVPLIAKVVFNKTEAPSLTKEAGP